MSKQSFSGVYPHLAVFNQSSGECGIGAVVPWAGRLWYLTYCPHEPKGSADKLYSIDPELDETIHPESVGGTPAGRMIHRESNQLIMGSYVIDSEGKVRVVPMSEMPGRLTAVARHLTDPANLVYVYDMEGALYELNVHSLEVTCLFTKPVPGWHGKGMYTAQGRLVIANNGECHVGRVDTTQFQVEDWPEDDDRAGCLAEWDGDEWRIIERRQHTEVMGPGGIFGNENEGDPVWTMGWDKRSCLLKVLDNGTWHSYRLPKANYTYDGVHGWHTEWPRIRQVADGFLMMDLHGMFYRFPETFTAVATGGIRPLSSHHQMVVDYCDWDGRTAVACNHASHFDNPLLGRCQSNLWFLEKGEFERFGPRSGWGGPWVNDDVAAGTCTEPFLFAGFDRRVLHLSHEGEGRAEFLLELDNDGSGNWQAYETISLEPNGATSHVFPEDLAAEWIRIRCGSGARGATAYFHYSEDSVNRVSLQEGAADKFVAIPKASSDGRMVGGIVRPMGKGYPQEETRLQYIAKYQTEDGSVAEQQYVVDQDMVIRADDDATLLTQFKEELKGEVTSLDFGVDDASIWIEEGGKRYRLPKGDSAYGEAFDVGFPRGKREVITERSVWNAHGSFYEIPRENSHGVRHMRPICTHNRKIMDYCTWRGLLTIAGVVADAAEDDHFVRSEDGKVSLWFGAVDDLWSLGKPVGNGGPWLDTSVKSGETSDPYLMTNYDEKKMTLGHDLGSAVNFIVEIDATGYDTWVEYVTFAVEPGETLEHEFETGFAAHWIRVRIDTDCSATAQFEYR